MSVKVQADTSGFQKTINQLQKPEALLEKIGQYLVSSTQARIRTTKVAPNGALWAPWAPSTARAKERSGQGGSLLLNSGRLFNSISHQVVAGQVEVTSNAPYARFLQLGTNRMPARPFLGISKDDESAIAGLVRRHIGA
jgi:phage virion morphogenesis protein